MKRGDIYVFVGKGDFSGKPRPGLIVQSDVFNETHLSITICPITSVLTGHDRFRVALEPGGQSGLKRRSEVEIDKLQSVYRGRVRDRIGSAPDEAMIIVDEILCAWLDL